MDQIYFSKDDHDDDCGHQNGIHLLDTFRNPFGFEKREIFHKNDQELLECGMCLKDNESFVKIVQRKYQDIVARSNGKRTSQAFQ